MWIEIAAGALMLGQYIYHRLTDKAPTLKSDREVTLPQNDPGSTIPLIYGKCCVRKPIIAWTGTPVRYYGTPGGSVAGGSLQTAVQDAFGGGTDPVQLLQLSVLFVLGIPFEGGDGTTRLHRIWAGDYLLSQLANTDSQVYVALDTLDGEGGLQHESPTHTKAALTTTGDPTIQGTMVLGTVEFLNGGTDQQLVDPVTFAETTLTAQRMVDDGVAPEQIPGHRGYAMALLSAPAGVLGVNWTHGTSMNISSYRFEVSSYPNFGLDAPTNGLTPTPDANPADVIYDILRGQFAKLGYNLQLIDYADTFHAVAQTLFDEGHGYSRALEETRTAGEHIGEILEQIDGVIYEDPSDGKIKIKLVRGDYDPATVPNITPSNCERIEGYAAGGWSGLVNKIRVVFSDRQNHYREGSVTAQNMANAVGQDNQVTELVMHFPGVCTEALAAEIASRELGFRSRPIAKCSAIVDRSFYRTVTGDVVALTWPEYGIDGLLFRVGNVDRGTKANGRIRLDLIQDFFYQYRGEPLPGAGVVNPFPVLVG